MGETPTLPTCRGEALQRTYVDVPLGNEEPSYAEGDHHSHLGEVPVRHVVTHVVVHLMVHLMVYVRVYSGVYGLFRGGDQVYVWCIYMYIGCT